MYRFCIDAKMLGSETEGVFLASCFKVDGSNTGGLCFANNPLGKTYDNNVPGGAYCTVTDKVQGLLIGNKGAPCDATGFGALPSSIGGGIAPGKSRATVFI
jgi:hypothetical protein